VSVNSPEIGTVMKCTLLLSSIALSTAVAEKPNIVFIMADDLGWSDVAHNGAKFYETPNFDQLTADGIKFTRSYVSGPNCAPTRASLISGMYTPRHQVWTPNAKSKGAFSNMKLVVPNRDNGKGDGLFPSKTDLDPKVESLAEVMNKAGYKTAMFGKWHCGPDQQGFDIFSGDGTTKPHKKHYGSPTVAATLTRGACDFIDKNKKDPFFLYLAHWDVHSPHRAEKKVVAKYKEKLKNGNWDNKWNPTYAAMIEAFDKSIGQVRQAIKKAGIANNTLIIVTSDNGTIGQVASGPLKGAKGSLFEGGVHVATSMVWEGVTKPGSTCDTPFSSVDYMPTFAELGGAPLPKNQPVDGKSLVPLIKGKKALKNRSIFWHYPLYLQANGKPVLPIMGTDKLYWRSTPSSMIVKGDWKLIHTYEDNAVLLYNIAEDPYEKNELSATSPEIAQVLRKELQNWVKETNAPIPSKVNSEFSAGSSEKGGKGKKSKGKKKSKKKKK